MRQVPSKCFKWPDEICTYLEASLWQKDKELFGEDKSRAREASQNAAEVFWQDMTLSPK